MSNDLRKKFFNYVLKSEVTDCCIYWNPKLSKELLNIDNNEYYYYPIEMFIYNMYWSDLDLKLFLAKNKLDINVDLYIYFKKRFYDLNKDLVSKNLNEFVDDYDFKVYELVDNYFFKYGI